MFKRFIPLIASGKALWYDVLLCIGSLIATDYFATVYLHVSWGQGEILAALFLILAISGQLVFFLVILKIWRAWQKRAESSKEKAVSFKRLAGIIIKGYLRATAVELIMVGILHVFHVSSLAILSILTLSFTSFYIITTIISSQYWKARDDGQAVLKVLCLGYGVQLLLLFFVKLL